MRNPTLKDISEYFRLALEAGLCREKEIECWADNMIIETSSPTPDWLLKLSIERETTKGKLLESVPGMADTTTVWNLLLARLGIGNRTKQFSRAQIVGVLYCWAANGKIPSSFFAGTYKLDNSYYGRGEEWYVEDQCIKNFENFFEPFRSFETFLPLSTLQALK